MGRTKTFFDSAKSHVLTASVAGAMAMVFTTLGRSHRSGQATGQESTPPLVISGPAEKPVVADAPKLQMEHRLAVRRILLDRLLIGILLVFAAGISAAWLEYYKASTAQNHFLLEKRLEAASAVRAGLTHITGPMFRITADVCSNVPLNKTESETLVKKINEFASILNT